jgi:hypothetical protein
MATRDYKLDALEIDESYRGLAGNVRTEGLKSVVANFIQNIERIDSLAKMPIGLFHFGSVQGQNHELAYQKATGKILDFFRHVQPSEEECRRIRTYEQKR